MPRSIHNPSTIHPPPGYSHIVDRDRQPSSPSWRGRRRSTASFQIVGGDDLVAQTRQVMENLAVRARRARGGLGRRRQGDRLHDAAAEYEAIGEAMAEAMGGAAPPAQVLLGVTSLALPELLIEIELVVSLA